MTLTKDSARAGAIFCKNCFVNRALACVVSPENFGSRARSVLREYNRTVGRYFGGGEGELGLVQNCLIICCVRRW